MKKITTLVAICVMSLTGLAFAQTHTQFITFDDNVGTGNAGTYNPTDSFSFDIYLTYSGYSSPGFDLWLETTANAAPFISLTAFSYGTTFFEPNGASLPVGFTLLQPTGLYTTANPSDLGATIPGLATPIAAGTYFIGHLSISLSGLAPGTYALQTDATSPHVSQVTDTNFADNNLPVSTYTITVVPEPSAFTLLSLAGIGGGAWLFRRVVTKRPRV